MGVRTNQMRTTQASTQIEWSVWVLGSALLLIALSVAHVMESFAQGLPGRFGMVAAEAGLVFAVGYAAHIVFVLLAAAEKPTAYIGNLVFGLMWLGLVALMHMATPGAAAGLLARTLEVGVIGLALVLSVSSLMAWRTVLDVRQEAA